MLRVSDNNERHKQTTKRDNNMRNHLVLLIAKYCRLLSAANRLKCGKKVKGSIMGTLNRLRASLARLDKAMRGEVVKFKNSSLQVEGLRAIIAWADKHPQGGRQVTVSRIINTI